MAVIEGFRVQNYRALLDVTLGQVKHEWAKKIAPLMDMDRNVSPSFCKFRDGLRQLCTEG